MVKSYTKKQFIEDVKKEAMALRKHATKEEIGKLDFENLEPLSVTRCIYGQLTGECDTPRASQLIRQCAPVLFEIADFNERGPIPVTEFQYYHSSPIERYITGKGAKNKNLIAYLKGECNDLVL